MKTNEDTIKVTSKVTLSRFNEIKVSFIDKNYVTKRPATTYKYLNSTTSFV